MPLAILSIGYRRPGGLSELRTFVMSAKDGSLSVASWTDDSYFRRRYPLLVTASEVSATLRAQPTADSTSVALAQVRDLFLA